MKKLRFFKCCHCGNVVVKLVNNNVSISCCGRVMEEIFANTVEASLEKHLPVVTEKNEFLIVKVGSVLHPMEENHYINFVALEMENGYSIVTLTPGQTPEVKFYIGDGKAVAIYEYCSLHGLWKIELQQ